jgi:hypothetical protein
MKWPLVFIAAMLSVNATGAANANTDESQLDDEGLAPVTIKGLDHVYVRPGANLSQYDRVKLDPVEVSFSKNWKPDLAGGPITAAARRTRY